MEVPATEGHKHMRREEDICDVRRDPRARSPLFPSMQRSEEPSLSEVGLVYSTLANGPNILYRRLRESSIEMRPPRSAGATVYGTNQRLTCCFASYEYVVLLLGSWKLGVGRVAAGTGSLVLRA